MERAPPARLLQQEIEFGAAGLLFEFSSHGLFGGACAALLGLPAKDCLVFSLGCRRAASAAAESWM